MKGFVNTDDVLIAKFMGGKFNSRRTSVTLKNNLPLVKIHSENRTYITSLLAYSKSWDWLIPVVQKIASQKGFNDVAHELLDLKITSKIEDVYASCVHYIKWYNTKQK